MKNLLFIISLFIYATSFSQETANTNTGVFDFKTQVIDYGTIQQNADGKRFFTFKNIGKSAIIITQIKSSCGCTIVAKPNKPILPGETEKIGVVYATNRIGLFSKNITIISNASESVKTLRIKGNVLKPKTQIISSVSN